MELKNIKGLGPKSTSLLNKLGIFNINDLVSYYPYRYRFLNVVSIDSDTTEEIVVKALVDSIVKVNYIKKTLNKLSFKVLINERLVNVVIFNRAFMKNNITINKEIILIGKYDIKTNTFIASNISFDIFDELKIEPVYHLINGLKRKMLNNSIKEALKNNIEIDDYIPIYLSKEYNFIDRYEALKYIHFPTSVDEIKEAKLRLIYEELFVFMFKINYLKYKNTLSNANIIKNADEQKLSDFINALPFKLTVDQLKAIDDIKNDFTSPKRMNRLILGDVGSGKTIVGVVAIYLNFLNGYQSSLMAPTEILAKQHYYNLCELLKNTGIKIEILLGSYSKKEQNNIKERLAKGDIDLLIGTHAIISNDVNFNNLGLVITDEQHRFGVNQRSNLQNKGIQSDVIYMSATPIPRTYALTLYGDMDISMIKEKPQGRKDIKTIVKKKSEIKDVLNLMLEELKSNHQIYVVAPLINENEELDLTDVYKLKDSLNKAFNSKVPIEILHGKLKNNEKTNIMEEFKNGNIKVLISTTVIEVGIDVKNATMIVIFNAERFGLATLHQLRGRVGRNDLESKCVLVSDSNTERLKILELSNDGFYISEEDFKMRGEGDLFGIKQSGDMNFKIANLKRNFKILLKAKEDSVEFINQNLENDFQNYKLYKDITKKLNFLD